MQKYLAVLGAFWMFAGSAQACSAVEFDYSSFSRPPKKLDIERYLAGQEDVYYLSLGLHGITLQISPANTEVDTRLAGIWEAWAQDGVEHPDFENFHGFFTQPERVSTPFAGVITGYRSALRPEHKPAANPDLVLEMLMAFIEFDGAGVASLYLNDPGDGGNMAEVMAELGALLTVDPDCVSASGAYEGRYIPEEARFVVFPVEAFRDPL